MRVIAVCLLPFALVAASEPAEVSPIPEVQGSPAFTTLQERFASVTADAANATLPLEVIDPAQCRDRIMQAREASGLPLLLERAPASPEKPFLIYAVDRQQDGCSVMVMMGNPNDIRPLPLPSEGAPGLIPADGNQ
ncbi:MAG: hypothetical protein QNJ15_13105 [Erythrobacter sp.]|nr:hypothetical protein [Erythrobacter sp.]